jgi:hypothetical protein
MSHRQIAAAVIGAALVAAVLIPGGAAGPAAKWQRVAIEERGGANGGTFKLIPLTPGPIKADSGTWMFLGATQKPTVILKGQTVKRFKGTDQFTGKGGTFRIPSVSSVLDAGGGFAVGTQTWSFSSGTGAYAGVSGGGAGAFVVTPSGRGGGDRFEGYVSKG